MHLLVLQDVIGIAVFSFSCLLLLGTIFFLRRTLIGLRSFKEEQKQYADRFRTVSAPAEKKKEAKNSFNIFLDKQKHTFVKDRSYPELPMFNRQTKVDDEGAVLSFKRSILEQKQQLDKLMQQVDGWKGDQVVMIKNEDSELRNKIERLELLLEDKDEEIQKLHKQNEIVDLMTSRLEQVQKEFDLLQGKLHGLEKQASMATQLAVELEDNKEECKQLQREQVRKLEKLQEITNENVRLHQQLAETEDKLQEANLQRQQLMRKTRLLEDLNTDFQTVSDTNSKMKNELRRIGELESMLNMMTQERDHLLRKRVL